MVGVFQPHAVALYGTHHLVDGGILRDDGLLQLTGHTLQAYALALGHPLHGHAGHHRHHAGHLLLGHRLAVVAVAALPLLRQGGQLCLQLRLTVSIAGGQLEVLSPDGCLLAVFHALQLFFLLGNLRRYDTIFKMYARACLVHGIDGLVGKSTVGNVAFCQFDTCHDGIVSKFHMVMPLIAVLDVVQDGERLLGGGGFHDDLLETSLQGAVLLDGVSVLVERGGTDTLDGASCQGGLHDVGGIHGPSRAAGTNDGVNLVDEDNEVVALLNLLQQRLDALLKLSAVFRAGHEARHVEADDALAEEHGRALALCDELCQSFHDGTLAHAGLADEDGVVLLAAAQYLQDALNLALTPHDGVQLVFDGSRCQVGREVVQHGRLALLFLCGLRLRGGVSASCRSLCRGAFVVFFLVLIGQADAAARRLSGLQQAQYVVVVHVVLFQYLFGSVVYLVVQDGQQQMLLVHALLPLCACFEHRQLQDVRCPLVEHQFAGVQWSRYVILSHLRLQVVLQLRDIEPQATEHVDDGALLHPQQAKQQMLRANGA